jgi:hypothetical protein
LTETGSTHRYLETNIKKEIRVYIVVRSFENYQFDILISMQGGGGQRQQCRFGMNCRKLQSNTCTFYHPPNELAMGGQGGQGGGQGGQGGQGGNPRGGFNDRTGGGMSGMGSGMGGGMGGGQTSGRGGRGDNSFIHHTSKYPPQQNQNSQQYQGQKPQ